ncbi:MAG TPA: protoporphyrinogen oxidase [Kofleriaceae bacterium]|nr:protoporphyrinogen oxidase [Kofleriaceae bacterium]
MKVAVVGGGIGGLTAAWRLVQDGHDVTVLEAGDRVGGVLHTVGDGGFRRELAANGFLSGAPDGAAALCEELGVPVVAAAPAARRRWVYLRGRLHALPGSPGGFVRSRLLTWRGKLALLAEPTRAARDVAVAGDQSMWDFAVRRFGPEVAHALVAPMITGVFAADAHEVSLAAGFPRLAALDARGGMVRGAIAEARARRKAGVARRPNRLSAPAGGMSALVDALADRLGARVRRGVEVGAVRPAGGGAGVDVEASGATSRHDAVVLALPAHRAAAVVRGALPALARGLDDVHYAPVAVAYLGYKARDVRADLGGFGFIVAAGEKPRLLGCVFESTVWSGRAPDGEVLLRLIYGGARDPGAADLDEPALLAQARADLAQVLGVRAAPVHASSVRWARGIAQYPVGHADRVAAWERDAHAARIVLAGSAYHGIAVNDCVADARRIARQVASWS